MMRFGVLCLLLMMLSGRVWGQSKPDVVTLPNGFTVIVQRRTASPLVALELWVQAGARDERNGENGCAHFIEHLVFKRGKTTTQETPDAAIENLGATLSAATGPDYARFYTAVAGIHTRKAIAILADVARNAEFPAEDIDRERGVILDELSICADDTSELLQNALYERVFPFHPYRFSPGGKPDSIAGLKRETLQAFYLRNYRPSRCVLVVVGNVGKDDAVQAAAQSFGRWLAAKTPDMPTENKRPRSQITTRYARGIGAQFAVGFPAPSANDSEIAATAVQAAALILSDRLAQEKLLVEPTVRYTPRLEASLLHIRATLNLADTKASVPVDIVPRYEKAEAIVMAHLERLSSQPPTAGELQSAQSRLSGRIALETESNSGLARTLGYAFATRGETPDVLRTRISALKPRDIQRAAQQVFVPAELQIVRLLPDRSPSLGKGGVR
jgi:zinc protease